jgi:very-short-patch-repair endonuclease
MKRIADPIKTTELCSYGCGNIAQYINGSKRLMCCKSSNSCPENKRKNSEGLKNSGRDYVESYRTLSQESKDRMNWSKGLTKDVDSRVARPQFIGRRFGASLNGHSKETKEKLSKIRTEWLKNPLNRKNLGRHKRSWMELTFEEYLKYNNITGWDTEVHFWNEELRKNYFPDFIFEERKLIIELDGTQHRKTVEQDAIRDLWFGSKGYKVIRVPVEEFKKRHFSGQGFLDLLGE